MKITAGPGTTSILSPFRWELLGYGLERAWLTGYFGLLGTMTIGHADGVGSGIALLAAECLACLALALFSRASKSGRSDKAVPPVTSALAAVFGVAGTVAIATGANFVLGSLLVGLCGGFFETVWVTRFLGMRYEKTQAYMMLVMAVSSMAGMALQYVSGTWFHLVSTVVLVASAALLYARLGRAEQEPFARPEQAAPSGGSPTRSLVQILVCCLVFSFAYNAFVTLANSQLGPDAASGVRNWANFIAAIALLVFSLVIRPLRPIEIFRVVPPVTAAGFVLFLVAPASFGGPALMFAGAGRKFFDILTWVLVVYASQCHNLPRLMYPGLLGFFKSAGYAVGLAVATLQLSESGGETVPLMSFLAVLVLVVIVCFFWLLPERVLEEVFPTAPAPTPDEVTRAQRQIRSLGESAGLTPRESEVFELLAQGRSDSVIAEKLGISKGTAHGHITHVYQKLGVHNRQEIIALIENHQAE